MTRPHFVTDIENRTVATIRNNFSGILIFHFTDGAVAVVNISVEPP